MLPPDSLIGTNSIFAPACIPVPLLAYPHLSTLLGARFFPYCTERAQISCIFLLSSPKLIIKKKLKKIIFSNAGLKPEVMTCFMPVWFGVAGAAEQVSARFKNEKLRGPKPPVVVYFYNAVVSG